MPIIANNIERGTIVANNRKCSRVYLGENLVLTKPIQLPPLYILEGTATFGRYIKQIDSNTLSTELSSSSYSGMFDLFVNDSHILSAEGRYPCIFDLQDLSRTRLSPRYDGDIYSVCKADNFLYYGGRTTQRIWKYEQISGQYYLTAGSSNLGGTILSIISVGDYLYAGTSGNRTYKILKSDLSIIAQTSQSLTAEKLIIHGDYLYILGGSSNGRIIRFPSDSLATVEVMVDNLVFPKDGFLIHEGVAYFGGRNNRIDAYDINTFDLLYSSPDFGGEILTLCISGNFIFAGGEASVGVIKKYKLGDLSFDSQSVETFPNINKIRIKEM